MSYILDALKKAEKERRRGQTPTPEVLADLDTAGIDTVAGSRRRLVWIALGLAGIGLAGGLGWYLGRDAGERPEVTGQEGAPSYAEVATSRTGYLVAGRPRCKEEARAAYWEAAVPPCNASPGAGALAGRRLRPKERQTGAAGRADDAADGVPCDQIRPETVAVQQATGSGEEVPRAPAASPTALRSPSTPPPTVSPAAPPTPPAPEAAKPPSEPQSTGQVAGEPGTISSPGATVVASAALDGPQETVPLERAAVSAPVNQESEPTVVSEAKETESVPAGEDEVSSSPAVLSPDGPPPSASPSLTTDETPAAAPEAATLEPEVVGVVPEYEQLPASVRARLPDIDIALHLYSDVVARRRVSINGRILRQGDHVTPELVLEEITPDGVVLRFEDVRFHRTVFRR